MSLETLVKAITESIICPPGSVVIIRGDLDEVDSQRLYLALEEVAAKGHPGQQLFITLPDDRPIEMLDEAMMERCGWVRVDREDEGE